MVDIFWTDEAHDWLKEIYDYIALDKQEIAKKVVDDIFEKTQILKTFPKAGYPYENVSDEDVRILLYGHYRIAYLIKNKNHIDILGVFHGSLDIDRFLNHDFYS